MSFQSYVQKRAVAQLDKVAFGWRTIFLTKPEELHETEVNQPIFPTEKKLHKNASNKMPKRWLKIGIEDKNNFPIFIGLDDPDFPVYTIVLSGKDWIPCMIAASFEKFIICLKKVETLADGRSDPVDLEENPLPDTDREAFLDFLDATNPGVDIEFWEEWLKD